MSFSKVQTAFAKKLTHYVNTKFDTDISIAKVDLSSAGQVKLKEVFVKDSHKDTIIYIAKLQTSILSFKGLIDGNTSLGDVSLDNANVVMRTYKGGKTDELQSFIAKFNKKKKKTKKPSKFLLTSDLVTAINTKFSYINLNKQPNPIVAYTNINGRVEDFKIAGPNIYGNIRNLQFDDQNGMKVEEMRADFTYTKSNMIYQNMYLKTAYSEVEGNMVMRYKRSDLADFLNKVEIEASFPKASVSLKDARCYYDEIGTADIMHFSTKMKGTLNDFILEELDLHSDQRSKIQGTIHFVNAFNIPKGFLVDANISHLESDYNHLKVLLPNLLGKTLPTSFVKLGHFTMSGRSQVTADVIKVKLKTITDIGIFNSDLVIKNFDDIDRASYKGNVAVAYLPLGEMIGDSLIGRFSMDVDVVGKGFTLAHLDTKIKGKILQHEYKGYNYQNISVNGTVKDKLFAGKLVTDDPNLKLTFEGLADLSKEKYKFDFASHVDYAEFNKLNLSKHDSISILRGDIRMAMIGNSLENMEGFVKIENASYSNQRKDYNFKDFEITSALKDSVQTVKINSTDIVSGRIKGKFLFKDLGKLAQNAVGSIYTNYNAFEVSPNQYLSFNFKVHNQVVNVFFPEIKLGKNTSFRGLINADDNKFKLTFKSPEILAETNLFKKIRLQIDNKNPLFNTQVSIDSINTASYKIADFNLVNITLNDSLHFRSEFIGGKAYKDKFNLSFYHTINKDTKSVIGFKKSNVFFNDTDWVLNPDQDSNNKLLYDHTTGRIDYKDFLLTSAGQGISFYGEQEGTAFQNYNIDLDRIKIEDLIPKMEDFEFKGLLNGGIWIESRNGMLIPTADIQLFDLMVNDKLQGNLIGEIKGTETNKKYSLDLYLEDEDEKVIATKGLLTLTEKNPSLDVDIAFDDFQIAILNVFTEGIMENVRGGVSGAVKLSGLIENPDFKGHLIANNTGMYFPFLNVDYSLENGTGIALDKHSFSLDEAAIFDTYLNTTGTLSGSISHNFFKKWYLDLHISTPNLLAMNTPEDDDALFYGTGYLSGMASITGNTDNVNIMINGSSNPGTEIVVPMSDIKTIESSGFIHYKIAESDATQEESYQEKLVERFNGITMDFNLEINKDATIEMIVDQATGSAIRGNGTGNIQMDIDTKGTFNMYGEYVVDKGFYIFKYGSFINKSFDVKRGGTINFGGDPLEAELDIEAVYEVEANPKVILTEYPSERDIAIALVTKITGELFHSDQEFDIEFPNASLSVSSELDFILNEQDTGNKMIQFVSLLVTGSFVDLNSDNVINSSLSNVGKDTFNSMSVRVSNAIVGLFSNPDDLIDFGVEYSQGSTSADALNNNDQLEVSAEARVGKNKNIILNGEVYVPTGGNQSNNNIAGVASVEIPLNPSETVKAKAFQRKKEIQNDVENLGYTRGIGISWQVTFERWRDLFRKKQKANAEAVLDSTPKKNRKRTSTSIPKKIKKQG